MKVVDDLWAAQASIILAAALELDVFTVIGCGSKTAADVARTLKTTQRRVERLLNALVAMAYLTKRGTQFRLTPVAETFLVRTKPLYMGTMVRMTVPNWMHMVGTIRSRKPAVGSGRVETRRLLPRLAKGLFPLSYYAARCLVQQLPEKELKKIGRVLDVGAGSGAWSLAFAQSIHHVRVTALDYPEVTLVTREYAQQFGVADRYNYLEGDLREIDLGRDEYDLVILGHIIHNEGKKWGKRLITRSYEALRIGGTLLIAEIIPNDDRTGPLFPVVFALDLLQNPEADVFTMQQYRHWLRQIGFSSIKIIQGAPSPLILATRLKPCKYVSR